MGASGRPVADPRRRVPDAVVLTVGEALPGFYQEMQALARNLGVPDGLVAAGWLAGEELAAAYRVADVVATPSLCFESFGLINLEAMQVHLCRDVGSGQKFKVQRIGRPSGEETAFRLPEGARWLFLANHASDLFVRRLAEPLLTQRRFAG